ncbi:uncharacterized protein C2845_PM03G30380 [Panicum miliaceum]|uniref:Uncharacterized protein n=1 Tax=Panicum miliaceum TaxID=4540 RepID=A0A3L6T5F1_PANMI|nr:uncharacterized protein C2845_PM03G30380 [Panicum miliaceum]
MDTVAPRLSRSSTRYGPVSSSAASFSGPVRKWRKAWMPLAGAGAAGSGGGASRGDNKVVLFRWTPVNGGSGGGGGAASGMEPAAAARRRYVPAAGEAENTSKKGTSSELNLNLELEDPDDDTDADMSTDEPRDVIDSNPRPESRLKRKAF